MGEVDNAEPFRYVIDIHRLSIAAPNALALDHMIIIGLRTDSVILCP